MKFYTWKREYPKEFYDYVTELDWTAICDELDAVDDAAAGRILRRGLGIGKETTEQENELNDEPSQSEMDDEERMIHDRNELRGMR